MIKPNRNSVVLFAGLILMIAATSAYWLYHSSPAPNQITTGENTSLPSNAASPSDRVQGSGNIYPAIGIPQIGSRSGNAVSWLQAWLDSSNPNAPSNINLSIQDVIQSLRNDPGGAEAFYDRVRQILDDESIDVARKREIIFALDRAATPAAFQMLVDLSRLNLPEAIKEAVVSAIGHIGDYYWDKQSLAQAIPMLLNLWFQSQDPAVLRSLAASMAKAADPAGINVLMDTVLNNSGSMAEIESSTDARVSAAWSALHTLYQPEVVPALQQRLQSNTNLLEASVSASLLAEIGDKGNTEARRALVLWAQGAGDQLAPIVREAFLKFGTLDSQQYLKAVMAQNPTFKSSLVKSTILSILRP